MGDAPTFVLGFKTLAGQIPDVAGTPLEDEHFDAASGDSLQRTTTGLMAWRKSDNWTAFTDGYTTWVNGPYGVQQRLNTERFDWEKDPIVKPNPPRRFAVWNGVSISSAYQSLSDILAAIKALVPNGNYALEWLVKAGEGGTYQATWDSSPLAIDGPAKIKSLCDEGAALGLTVTPYFVIRGKPEWIPAEITQIAAAAGAAGRLVLNLEPGNQYWDGPTDAPTLTTTYLAPLKAAILAASPDCVIEVAGIPRQWCVDTLGVANTLDAWAIFANRMAWECYDSEAPDLDVAASMDRVRVWLAPVGSAQGEGYHIPIVQRSRIGAWAGTPYASAGVEVWCLDSDI